LSSVLLGLTSIQCERPRTSRISDDQSGVAFTIDLPTLTSLRAGSREQPAGKGIVRQLRRQRPGQPGLGRAPEVLLNGAACNPQHPTDLAGAHPAICKPQHLPQFSHRQLPLRRHHRLRLG
jgi:hypothetical protein